MKAQKLNDLVLKNRPNKWGLYPELSEYSMPHELINQPDGDFNYLRLEYVTSVHDKAMTHLYVYRSGSDFVAIPYVLDSWDNGNYNDVYIKFFDVKEVQITTYVEV